MLSVKLNQIAVSQVVIYKYWLIIYIIQIDIIVEFALIAVCFIVQLKQINLICG